MDFYKVPIGFGMTLAVNEPAMNAYSNFRGQARTRDGSLSWRTKTQNNPCLI